VLLWLCFYGKVEVMVASEGYSSCGRISMARLRLWWQVKAIAPVAVFHGKVEAIGLCRLVTVHACSLVSLWVQVPPMYDIRSDSARGAKRCNRIALSACIVGMCLAVVVQQLLPSLVACYRSERMSTPWWLDCSQCCLCCSRG